MKYIIILSTILLIQTATKSIAQEIKISDIKTNQPISFANICIEELCTKKKYFTLSGDSGKALNPFSSTSIISVSALGYKNYSDTIGICSLFSVNLIPSTFDVDEVVITGQYTPVTIDKSIYPVKVLGKNIIAQRGANSLNDLLRSEVSYSIQNDGVLGAQLSMRGLSGNNIKILVDGVPVIGRLAENIDLSQLSLYNIDHVEIVEGPMSVLYGNNAMGGIINLISKENQRNNLQFNANTYYESVGTYNADAGFSISRKKHNISFNLARNFFAGYDTDKNSRSKIWKPKEIYNTDLYYIFQFPKGKIKYQFAYMNEELRDYGDLLPVYFETAEDKYFYTRRINNKIEYSQRINETTDLNFAAAYSSYWRNINYAFRDLTTLNTLSNRWDSAQVNAIVMRGVISKENKLNKLNFQFGYDINYEEVIGMRILDEKKTSGDYALFVSNKWNVCKSLQLQSGLRYFYNTNFKTPLVPSLHALLKFSDFVNFRFSYTRGFRSPSLKQLFIYFKDINHDIQPNPDLSSEYGNNYNFTAVFNTDKNTKLHFGNYEFSMFYNDLRNVIWLAQVTDKPVVYKNVNLMYYRTLGGIIKMQYRYYPGFTFSLGLGQTGVNASNEISENKLSKYKFTPELTLESSYKFNKTQMQIAVSYKYSGQMFQVNLFDSGLSFGQRQAYNMLDATLSYPFYKKQITVTLGGKNLFNITDIQATGSSGAHSSDSGSTPVSWGRTFFIRISFQLNKNS